MELHVLGATDDDKLWHAIRKTSTTWPQKFKDVTTLTHSSEGEKFRAVAAATNGQELHVLAATRGGTLLHTIRTSSGGWNALQSVEDPAGEVGVTVDAACTMDVSGSATHGDLHVLVVTNDGKLWHTIRKADTSWPHQFADVTRLVPSSPGGKFRAVAAATTGEELHVVAATREGTLLHTIRKSSGGWNALQDVDKAVEGELGVIVDAACAMDVSGDLHVLVVTDDSKLWHTIRKADTSWPHKFADVDRVVGGPGGPFRAVAAAINGRELHVVAATREGTLLHTIRKPSGAEFKWDPFRDVEQWAGERGRFAALATAGSP